MLTDKVADSRQELTWRRSALGAAAGGTRLLNKESALGGKGRDQNHAPLQIARRLINPNCLP